MKHLLSICAWVVYTSDRKTSLLLRGLNRCHRVSPHFQMFVVILVSECHLPKQKVTRCFRGLLLPPWTSTYKDMGSKPLCLLCHTNMFLTDDSENISTLTYANHVVSIDVLNFGVNSTLVVFPTYSFMVTAVF